MISQQIVSHKDSPIILMVASIAVSAFGAIILGFISDSRINWVFLFGLVLLIGGLVCFMTGVFVLFSNPK
jgi:hypothetical protein